MKARAPGTARESTEGAASARPWHGDAVREDSRMIFPLESPPKKRIDARAVAVAHAAQIALCFRLLWRELLPLPGVPRR
jgi:hypothetical protein